MMRLPAIFQRFRRAKDGLAAVEFAFILPVMITMFFGTVEMSNALGARADVTSMASTAADLVAQQSNMTNADMTNVMSAVNSILYPYTTNSATIVISSVVVDSSGNYKVAWSDVWKGSAASGSARTVGSTITTLPAGLLTAGSGQGIIMAEITYNYTSASTQLMKLPITMSNVFYSKPRKSLTVTRSAS